MDEKTRKERERNFSRDLTVSLMLTLPFFGNGKEPKQNDFISVKTESYYASSAHETPLPDKPEIRFLERYALQSRNYFLDKFR